MKVLEFSRWVFCVFAFCSLPLLSVDISSCKSIKGSLVKSAQGKKPLDLSSNEFEPFNTYRLVIYGFHSDLDFFAECPVENNPYSTNIASSHALFPLLLSTEPEPIFDVTEKFFLENCPIANQNKPLIKYEDLVIDIEVANVQETIADEEVSEKFFLKNCTLAYQAPKYENLIEDITIPLPILQFEDLDVSTESEELIAFDEEAGVTKEAPQPKNRELGPLTKKLEDFENLPEILAQDLSSFAKQALPSQTYPVVLHPRKKTQLYAEILAPIQKIWFRMGDAFEKGDILIKLKDDVYLGKHEKAVAFQEKSQAELEATQELFNDYIASKFELKEAEAAVAEAQAEVLLAQNDLQGTTIRAPYSGRVVSLFVEEYELPPSDKRLIEIIDDKVLTAKLLIKADQLDELHIGQPIEIKISSTGETIEAVFTRIGAIIDPSSSTIKVEAEIDNREGHLKAGMVGTATLSEAKSKDG